MVRAWSEADLGAWAALGWELEVALDAVRLAVPELATRPDVRSCHITRHTDRDRKALTGHSLSTLHSATTSDRSCFRRMSAPSTFPPPARICCAVSGTMSFAMQVRNASRSRCCECAPSTSTFGLEDGYARYQQLTTVDAVLSQVLVCTRSTPPCEWSRPRLVRSSSHGTHPHARDFDVPCPHRRESWPRGNSSASWIEARICATANELAVL